MSKAKVFYILLVTLVGIFFLYRESINIYWAQTYHRESPLVSIERWLESQMDNLDGQGFQGDEAAPQTEIIAIDGLKDAVQPMEETTKEITEEAIKAPIKGPIKGLGKDAIVSQEEKPETQETPYRYLETEFAGPLLPQLPKELIVTAGDKLFFVGDSLMQGVAPRVRQSLYKSENIDGVDLSKQSTGLAYPKFYNWPEVVENTLKQDTDIQAVVVYMGANDPWDFPVPGRKQYLRFKSADWERAYRERVQKIILSAYEHQLPVIWLGAPCMRKEKLHQDMVYLNTIYASEMAKFNGTYLPTSDLLGCSDEGYSAYVETDTGNLKVRTNDGIHFTPTGQRRIAERIIAALTIHKEEELPAQESEENLEDSSESAPAPIPMKIELISEAE